MKDVFIIRKSERGHGKVHAFALELERIANERRALFINSLEKEIESRIYTQCGKAQRYHKENNIKDIYNDVRMEYMRGRVTSLKELLVFIEEQKKLFTYHDNPESLESEDTE